MTFSEVCLTILTLCAIDRAGGHMARIRILIETLLIAFVVGWIATGALNGLPS